MRILGPEAASGYGRRQRNGFFLKYLSGSHILDIGYKGGCSDAVPITDSATGVGLDYPGYDGKHLPFPDNSQDAVFSSHCLEHIDNYRTALAEWYRVLRIGGYLIIMVPHRDLYERKSGLPSRFNGDHKRFYTPASLLIEIEGALPVGGYRIVSLMDVDEGFDYSIPPEQHARGSYEIELVVKKIELPTYHAQLRLSETAESLLKTWDVAVLGAYKAHLIGDEPMVPIIQRGLEGVPLPPFSRLVDLGGTLSERQAEDFSQWLHSFLAPMIAAAPFEESLYLSRYPDLEPLKILGECRLHDHYQTHGYFEGRVACSMPSDFC